MHRLSFRTRSKADLQDITLEVQKAVQSSGVASGVCHIFVPHTTAGITLNEHADPSVVDDITTSLDTLAPENIRYRHMEGNSPGHIKTSLIGSSVAVFVEDGQLVLGTWQGIFLCEFDGPRNRTILIKVIPDKS